MTCNPALLVLTGGRDYLDEALIPFVLLTFKIIWHLVTMIISVTFGVYSFLDKLAIRSLNTVVPTDGSELMVPRGGGGVSLGRRSLSSLVSQLRLPESATVIPNDNINNHNSIHGEVIRGEGAGVDDGDDDDGKEKE